MKTYLKILLAALFFLPLTAFAITTAPWAVTNLSDTFIYPNLGASKGIVVTASSTIGDSTQVGGLTINGGATTTSFLAITGTTGTTSIASGQGFTVGGSQFFLQQGSGKIGIGTSTPDVPFAFYTTTLAAHADPVGLNQSAVFAIDGVTGTGAPPSGAIQMVNGEFQINYQNSGTAVSNNFNVFRFVPQIGSGVSTNYTGIISSLNSQPRNNSTGTTTQINGVAAAVLNTNTGTTTKAIAYFASSATVSGGGSITNAYGLDILAQKTAGVTNGYGVYQEGASDINYFAGRVGIGTTSPVSLLTVSGSNSATTLTGNNDTVGLLLENTNSTNNTFSSLTFGGITSAGAQMGVAKIIGVATGHTAGSTSGDLAFLTRYSATSNLTETMRITSGGNVGIGTTSPFATLSLAGAAGGTTNLFAISTSTSGFATSTALTINQNGNVSLLNGTSLTLSSLGTAAGAFLAVNASGQVIATTTPGGTGTVTSVTAATPNSTLILGGTNPITTSGTINFDLNLAHSNVWSVLQTFGNASTTAFTTNDAPTGYTGIVSPIKSLSLQTGTTTSWTASTTGAYIPSSLAPFAGTIKDIKCATDASFLGIEIDINGSAIAPSYFVASTTKGVIVPSGSNTFTYGDAISFKAGTTTSSGAATISCILRTVQTT